jgi:hypothetical protein
MARKQFAEYSRFFGERYGDNLNGTETNSQ